MSARKSTSRRLGGSDFSRDDSDFISDNEHEHSSGSSEIFRLRLEAETYKSKYRDAQQQIAILTGELQSLRERLGYIAAATNVLLPITSVLPASVQANIFYNDSNYNKRPVSRSATPPMKRIKQIQEEEIYPVPTNQAGQFQEEERYPTPTNQARQYQEELEKSVLEPTVILEKLEIPKRPRGRPPTIKYSEMLETTYSPTNIKFEDTIPERSKREVSNIIPIFELDNKYPNITQDFLLQCHNYAEMKIQRSGKTEDALFRDRIFVRLVFHEIFDISELWGRSATGKAKRMNNKKGAQKEIDPAKKRFIRAKLKERVYAIDPMNVVERTQHSMLNRWFSSLVTNRINRHKVMMQQEQGDATIQNTTTPGISYSVEEEDDDEIYEIYDEPVEEDYDDEENSIHRVGIKTEILNSTSPIEFIC